MPAEDGALQSAITDLDRKLSEYAVAVRAIADQIRSPQRDANQPDTPEAPEQTHSSCDVRQAMRDRLAGHAEQEPPPHGPATSKPQQVMETPPVQKAASLTTAAPEPVTEDTSEASQIEAPAPEPSAEKASEHPMTDEALLASLDELTAKAVHVLRRLNPKKPIQELLEQVRKQPAEQQPKLANKAWFRFGR